MNPFTGVYKNSANLVGDGYTSRLDLNSSIHVNYGVVVGTADNEHAAVGPLGFTVTHTASGAGGMIEMIIMMVVMVAIFYFLLIRPQRKKDKAVKEMLEIIRG